MYYRIVPIKETKEVELYVKANNFNLSSEDYDWRARLINDVPIIIGPCDTRYKIGTYYLHIVSDSKTDYSFNISFSIVDLCIFTLSTPSSSNNLIK